MRGRRGREQGSGRRSDFFAGDVTLQARLHYLDLTITKRRPDQFDDSVLGQPQVRIAPLLRAVAKKGS